jgi:hypothetical protein
VRSLRQHQATVEGVKPVIPMLPQLLSIVHKWLCKAIYPPVNVLP